jgi:maleylacetate reductase
MSETFVHEQGASRVVFGAGSLARAAEEVERLGAERVLLICDRHSAPYADTVAERLGGRVAGRVRETATHVPLALAEAATAAAHDADLLLSIGGGSVTGLAKAVALRTRLRIVAVPTTYAGSEMTPIWGVTRDGRKETGRDRGVQPVTVIYDPELTAGLPAGLAAASGMNALAHLVAGVIAPLGSPLTAAVALDGIEILAGALPRVVIGPADPAAREDTLRGAWLAGWVLGTTRTGLHHTICHVLGGAYGLPHAATHSAVLPYAAGRDAEVARVLGATDAASGLWELRDVLGAPAALSELGFGASDADRAAALVAAARPGATVDAVRRVLLAALDGERPSTTGGTP